MIIGFYAALVAFSPVRFSWLWLAICLVAQYVSYSLTVLDKVIEDDKENNYWEG